MSVPQHGVRGGCPAVLEVGMAWRRRGRSGRCGGGRGHRTDRCTCGAASGDVSGLRHGRSRVHSTYRRRLADRPIGGRRVILRLMVRRFLCDNAACKRRTVAEQVEHLMTPYRHCTQAVTRMGRTIGPAVHASRTGPTRSTTCLPRFRPIASQKSASMPKVRTAYTRSRGFTSSW
ncbi:transposase family protein [Streptomyces sp. NPDC056004]|uniref:transposase family protein n=1 Tax=Streptomyces sp. NPDC056004 TaxID=3345677 RepID=UPI0035D6FDE0